MTRLFRGDTQKVSPPIGPGEDRRRSLDLIRWLTEEWPVVLTVFVALILASVLFLISWSQLVTSRTLTAKLARDLAGLFQSKADLVEIQNRIADGFDRWISKSISISVLQHLAIGLFVACLLIVLIEFQSRRRLRRDVDSWMSMIGQNVWRGVMRRLVSEKVCNELEVVLQSPFVKEHCRYRITIDEGPDSTSDLIVLEVQNSYTIRNLTSTVQNFPCFSRLDAPYRIEDPADKSKLFAPKFLSLKIADTEMVDTSTQETSPTGVRIDHSITIPAHDSKNFYFKYRIARPFSDNEAFTSRTAMDDIEVQVLNRLQRAVGNIRVDFFHPGLDTILRPVDDSWVLPKAMLPGQGFGISWRDIRSSDETQPPSTTPLVEPAVARNTMTPETSNKPSEEGLSSTK